MITFVLLLQFIGYMLLVHAFDDQAVVVVSVHTWLLPGS